MNEHEFSAGIHRNTRPAASARVVGHQHRPPAMAALRDPSEGTRRLNHRNTCEGTHAVHALILGRALTGIAELS